MLQGTRNYEHLTFVAFLPRGVPPKTVAKIETRLRRNALAFLKCHHVNTSGYRPRYGDYGGVYATWRDDDHRFDSDRHELELRIYVDVAPGTSALLGLTP